MIEGPETDRVFMVFPLQIYALVGGANGRGSLREGAHQHLRSYHDCGCDPEQIMDARKLVK